MTSTATLDASSDILPAGQITFFQAVLPPVQAGDYTLLAMQRPTDAHAAELARYEVAQQLRVDGPRYTLPPDLVQLVYPPANHQGDFGTSFPHVVLSSPDLPWVRDIAPVSPPAPAPAHTPWLALLTVYVATEGDLVTRPTRMTVGDVLTPGAGVVGPDLGAATAGDPLQTGQPCLAVDIDGALFAAIAPRLDELQYLAHARQVSTADKETGGGVQAGFYSVVVGNRLADSAAGAARDSLVLLVSLEGHAAHLPDQGGPPANTKVRLFAMASWSFTTGAFPGDFIDLMQAVGVDRAQVPHRDLPATTAAQQQVRMALDIGYVPLTDETRSGERSTAWYRSPLAAYATTRDLHGPYPTSDSAMRYDPGVGVFDHSYAAAWQVGRQLALSDASFTRTMIAWRRQAYAAAADAGSDALLTARLPAPAATLAFDAAPPRSRGEQQHAHLQSVLRAQLGPLTRAGGDLPTVTPRRRRLDPRRQPGVLSQQSLEQARQDGEDLVHTIVAHVHKDRR